MLWSLGNISPYILLGWPKLQFRSWKNRSQAFIASKHNQYIRVYIVLRSPTVILNQITLAKPFYHLPGFQLFLILIS